MRVQHRAEYGAPLCEGMPGQQGEKAAGRAFDAFGLVAVPERVGGSGDVDGGGGLEHGADPFTAAAQDAGIPDHRTQKALVIRR